MNDADSVLGLVEEGVLPPVLKVERRKNVRIVHFDHTYYEKKGQSDGRLLFWVCFDGTVKESTMENGEHLEMVVELRKRVACRVLTIKALSFLENFDEIQLRKILVRGWAIENPVMRPFREIVDK